MEGVFQWIKNITYYLIFISLLSHLMPGGKYVQYTKLFFGAVFILLVIHPLTGGLQLDGKLVQAYERIRFTQEQEEFRQKLWGMEEERMEQIMAQYEEAVSLDIQAMAEAEGFNCISARASIEGREEEENFGQVERIYLVIRQKEEKYKSDENKAEIQEGERETEAERAVSIAEVKVVIEQDKGQEQEGKKQEKEEDYPGEEYWKKREHTESQGNKEKKENEKNMGNGQDKIEEFQRKVAEYYGLEEEAVQITWQDN